MPLEQEYVAGKNRVMKSSTVGEERPVLTW